MSDTGVVSPASVLALQRMDDLELVCTQARTTTYKLTLFQGPIPVHPCPAVPSVETIVLLVKGLGKGYFRSTKYLTVDATCKTVRQSIDVSHENIVGSIICCVERLILARRRAVFTIEASLVSTMPDSHPYQLKLCLHFAHEVEDLLHKHQVHHERFLIDPKDLRPEPALTRRLLLDHSSNNDTAVPLLEEIFNHTKFASEPRILVISTEHVKDAEYILLVLVSVLGIVPFLTVGLCTGDWTTALNVRMVWLAEIMLIKYFLKE